MTRDPSTIVPAKRGPGRPRKAGAPRNEDQTMLKVTTAQVEAKRDAAQAAYDATPTVATEQALLSAELIVATAWSAYLRADNNHAQAIKYGEVAVKFAGRLAALHDIATFDKTAVLEAALAARTAKRASGKRART